jgi:tRNA/tmRNA/rRNA uracil-C5-methylase (TrmA/RlmC/RlmD family)
MFTACSDQVVGVDIVAEAIEDAKANALRNKVTNVEFVCGKAEDVMPGLLSKYAAQVLYTQSDQC